MNLTCPHCHTSFEVDKSHYADLLAQVKNAEFDKELDRRIKEMAETQRAQSELMKLRMEAIKKDELDKKDHEIAELKSQLNIADKERELKVQAAENAAKEKFTELAQTVSELKSKLENERIMAQKSVLELKNNNEILLKAKDLEIERLKDMKARLSTKMLGETLEQHCQVAFDTARAQGLYMTAEFGKDNDASSGSKGDFIFRDFIDGVECLSIMFEMKNESDQTVSKHKNEDFFAKLDRDRATKKCEYAVLVSTLEPDNDLYNGGIVDVSFRYDKMFVIRPQFFLPLISLLSRASKRSAGELITLRKELASARETSIDISTFEARRDKFAEKFKGHLEAHFKKHESAMESIDKAIAAAEKQLESLKKVKAVFEDSRKKLEKANEDIETDFTIRKLTHGNPTMRAKFAEIRQK